MYGIKDVTSARILFNELIENFFGVIILMTISHFTSGNTCASCGCNLWMCERCAAIHTVYNFRTCKSFHAQYEVPLVDR